MPLIPLGAMKEDLGITHDADDDLIMRKIAAAQSYLEVNLGYRLEEEFPDEMPGDILQALTMLAANAYENREASIVGVSISSVPYGVDDIIRNRRRYSFGG